MKKLTKALIFAMAILIISSVTYAVYELSPWKTRSGDSLGTPDKLWTYVHSEYIYIYKDAGIVAEGDTEDDYETTITFTDPTADNALGIPDDTGMFLISELTTNAPDAANSIWGESNSFVFEGATADAFELSLTLEDPTVDRTITMPDYSGSIPLVVAQGYTQTSSGETTYAVDVTGSSITLPSGWFTEGKAIRYTLAGTSIGTEDVVSFILYFEDAAVCTLASADGIGAGESTYSYWNAQFTIVAESGETQRVFGNLVAENGTETITSYATDTTTIASAGTIPVKVQTQNTAGETDVTTVEYVLIETWSKTD